MSLLPRAVVDTSTLVSAALRPGSVPADAFRLALARFELACCDETLQELDSVLQRPKFDRYLPLEDRQLFVTFVRQTSRPVRISAHHWAAAQGCSDPNDVMFLALALAASAQVLISSYVDLWSMHPFEGVQVLAPADFLARFED